MLIQLMQFSPFSLRFFFSRFLLLTFYESKCNVDRSHKSRHKIGPVMKSANLQKKISAHLHLEIYLRQDEFSRNMEKEGESFGNSIKP